MYRSIVVALVERRWRWSSSRNHGERIWAESVRGRGATFSFSLTARTPAGSHAESETPAGGVDERSLLATLEEALACRGESGARILLVDDDEGPAAKREVTHDGA